MREKAAEFRKRAQELHQAAEKVSDPVAKRRLLESEAEFLSLADKMEKAAMICEAAKPNRKF